MSKNRLELKVGLFVFVGLVLVGFLLLQFSKGPALFRSTYDIKLEAIDIGGLKPRAAVMMSGVEVGTVGDIRLAPDSQSVIITLEILSKYTIHKDAKFSIEQSGFLGDQNVAIRPGENKLPPFEDGDVAHAEKPFSLQEFMGSSSGFIARIDETVRKLDEAISNINQSVLSPGTLTNLSATAGNLRTLSERAMSTIQGINVVVETNQPVIALTISNALAFSERMNATAGELEALVATNRPAVDRAVSNVEDSTATLKSVMADVQSGKGLAGTLVYDKELALNVEQLAENLRITSSNLNRLGLWGILWKKKDRGGSERSSAPDRPLESPKAATR